MKAQLTKRNSFDPPGRSGPSLAETIKRIEKEGGPTITQVKISSFFERLRLSDIFVDSIFSLLALTGWL